MTARLVARCLEPECGWSYNNARRDNAAVERAVLHFYETRHDYVIASEDDGYVAPVKVPARVTMFGGAS
jgi:hypothetical protein